MFGFHKPKMYRSLDGCCICRAKSSSSRFTDSKRYEKDFMSCFGPKKLKSLSKRARPSQISRLQKELKRNNSDAHSTTSSASPAQSPSYSNPSDEGSDTELSPGSSRSPRVCCGIIYKGRFGEVLIDPHLFKPCCRKKQQRQRLEEEEEYEEVEVEVVEVAEEVGKEEEVEEEEEEEGEEVKVKRSNNSQKSLETPQLQVTMTTPQTEEEEEEVEEEDW
ncbi:unnamed protein product [Coregonus sp. 'balchen']|nr:unnamed protein product [Coregonus sp. 'balchen']